MAASGRAGPGGHVGAPGLAWFRSGFWARGRWPGEAWTIEEASAPGVLAEGVVQHATDPTVLDGGGWWAVVVSFEGRVDLWRFAAVRPAPLPPARRPWVPVPPGAWASSLKRDSYLAGVEEIRRRIREGDIYQVNLCRVLQAPAEDAHPDPLALAQRLMAGNPAPYSCVIDVPGDAGVGEGTRIVSASPELFLARDGRFVRSSPIKGTGVSEKDLLPKDDAENVMIVDLVRNDLQRVCRAGRVEGVSLLRVERHPGLVHLVSTVQGELVHGVGWARVMEALCPAGSVSGAPKSTALRTIRDLEPVPRGPYCGAVGWVDADRGQACLSVGIRTFWWDEGWIRFGTGAGITWGSEPDREWRETCLKARRLLAVAASLPQG